MISYRHPTQERLMGRSAHSERQEGNEAGRDGGADRGPPLRAARVARGSVAVADAAVDLVELGVGALAEGGDGEDAHHSDEGEEEGVLDERSATLTLAELGPNPPGQV